MDDSSSGYLAAITAFIMLNALVTLAYAALVNSRIGPLQEDADSGNRRAAHALKLLDAKSRLMLTYNLVTTLLKFGIAVLAAMVFLWPPTSNISNALAGGGLVLITALLTVLLGDILPESLGSTYAQPLAKLVVGPLRTLVILFNPLTLLLLWLGRMVASVLGVRHNVNMVTEEEIMTLVNAGNTGGTIHDEEKAMIYSVLQLDDTTARELMTPRIDIRSLEVTADINEALEAFIESGFSRIPIYEETIDNIIGLLYAKDLLEIWRNGSSAPRTIRDLIRPGYFVHENMPANALLRELRKRSIHMAIVIDEYGGTSGLITIEGLIEEIVGDIRDEYDTNEEAEYVQEDAYTYLCDATMDLDDVNDLFGLQIETDETDTLGGYVYFRLGRVPDLGEVVEEDDFRLKVAEIDGHRIRKVLLVLTPDTEQSDDVYTPLDHLLPDPDESDDTLDNNPPRMADAS